MSAPGTFLLTFDVELLWGLFFDARWRRRARNRYGEVREVFPELLAILARHDIPATFAFVGHLFLAECRPVDGVAHPEMPRPKERVDGGDWYSLDPYQRVPDCAEVQAGTEIHEVEGHEFVHRCDTDVALTIPYKVRFMMPLVWYCAIDSQFIISSWRVAESAKCCVAKSAMTPFLSSIANGWWIAAACRTPSTTV